MAEPLHFMMGQYQARIPADRFYSGRHMWLQEQSGGAFRVGFTDYSVRLLQDIYFLEWSIDANTIVPDRHEIGEVESSKAVSSIFAPFAGEIFEFNSAILNDPALINSDNYGTGWLFAIKTSESMLSPEAYLKVLEDGWDDTHRHIKGQVN